MTSLLHVPNFIILYRDQKISALIGYVTLLPRIFNAIATSTKNLLKDGFSSNLENVDDEKIKSFTNSNFLKMEQCLKLLWTYIFYECFTLNIANHKPLFGFFSFLQKLSCRMIMQDRSLLVLCVHNSSSIWRQSEEAKP